MIFPNPTVGLVEILVYHAKCDFGDLNTLLIVIHPHYSRLITQSCILNVRVSNLRLKRLTIKTIREFYFYFAPLRFSESWEEIQTSLDKYSRLYTITSSYKVYCSDTFLCYLDRN